MSLDVFDGEMKGKEKKRKEILLQIWKQISEVKGLSQNNMTRLLEMQQLNKSNVISYSFYEGFNRS